MIQGIKLQRGGTKKVENYPGYKLCFGNISVSSCLNNKFIPLTVRVNLFRIYLSSNGTYAKPRLRITKGGTTTSVMSTATLGYTSDGNFYASAGEIMFDLETYYGGDLDTLKSITNIFIDYDWHNTSSYDGRNNAGCSLGGVRRWLEPA